MTVRVVTTTSADDDIEGAIAYYLAADAADAAEGFVDELEAAWRVLRQHPSSRSPRFAAELGIPDLRTLALRGFPYVLFYLEELDTVRIVRVLHASRDIPETFR